MMVGVADPIHGRIAQVHVVRLHVNFRSQRFFAVLELAVPHPLKQIEVFFDRSISIRAVFAGDIPTAPVLANFFKGLVTNVSVTVRDQLHRPLVKLIEVVGRKMLAVPLKAQPLYIVTDRVNVFGVFFFRVRVVETKIALAIELFGDAKAQTDGFRMPQVQITVGLGRKTSMHTTVVQSGRDIISNDLTNEIEFLFWFIHDVSL